MSKKIIIKAESLNGEGEMVSSRTIVAIVTMRADRNIDRRTALDERTRAVKLKREE